MPEFDDEDWHELLAELRLIVIGAGFADWDANMVRALQEESEQEDRLVMGWDAARRALFDYAKGFRSFLSVRSARNLARLRGDFSDLVAGDHGGDVLLADPSGELSVSLLEGQSSDALIAEIDAFVHALLEDDGYFDGPEFSV